MSKLSRLSITISDNDVGTLQKTLSKFSRHSTAGARDDPTASLFPPSYDLLGKKHIPENKGYTHSLTKNMKNK